MKKVVISLMAMILSVSLFSGSTFAAVNYVDPQKTEAELTGAFGVTLLTMYIDAKFSYDGKAAKVISKKGGYSKKIWGGTLNVDSSETGEEHDPQYGSAVAYHEIFVETGIQISGVGWVWDSFGLRVSQSASKEGMTASWTTEY